jgi:hypothetical protein
MRKSSGYADINDVFYVPSSELNDGKNDGIVLEDGIYICNGDVITSVIDKEHPIKLAKDTKLYHITDIEGSLNGCKIKVKYSKDNGTKDSILMSGTHLPCNSRISGIDLEAEYKKKMDERHGVPFMMASVSGAVKEVRPQLKTSIIDIPESGKIYVKNASFYINGFVVTNTGYQEIVLTPNNKLKAINTSISIMDEEGEWSEIKSSAITFKFTEIGLAVQVVKDETKSYVNLYDMECMKDIEISQIPLPPIMNPISKISKEIHKLSTKKIPPPPPMGSDVRPSIQQTEVSVLDEIINLFDNDKIKSIFKNIKSSTDGLIKPNEMSQIIETVQGLSKEEYKNLYDSILSSAKKHEDDIKKRLSKDQLEIYDNTIALLTKLKDVSCCDPAFKQENKLKSEPKSTGQKNMLNDNANKMKMALLRAINKNKSKKEKENEMEIQIEIEDRMSDSESDSDSIISSDDEIFDEEVKKEKSTEEKLKDALEMREKIINDLKSEMEKKAKLEGAKRESEIDVKLE